MAKAEAVISAVSDQLSEIQISVAKDREAACGEADMIVAAIGSDEPVVLGDWGQPGTHTDFIGNHHATKRETADEITLFKPVGMAMSDLVGAGLVYETATA